MRATYLALFLLAAFSAMAVAMAGGHGSEATSGQAVFEANCASCHSGGFGGFFTGAPKVGKKADWEPLIAKGVDTLTANTIAGIGKMAARGECASCTDADIRAAVSYMVESSQ